LFLIDYLGTKCGLIHKYNIQSGLYHGYYGKSSKLPLTTSLAKQKKIFGSGGKLRVGNVHLSTPHLVMTSKNEELEEKMAHQDGLF